MDGERGFPALSRPPGYLPDIEKQIDLKGILDPNLQAVSDAEWKLCQQPQAEAEKRKGIFPFLDQKRVLILVTM